MWRGEKLPQDESNERFLADEEDIPPAVKGGRKEGW